MHNVNIGFVLNYIIIPLVIGLGIWSGRKYKNHLRIAIASGVKGCFYLYCAIANFLNYINDSWAISYAVGFTIALAIMEGLNGLLDCAEESKRMHQKKPE